MERSWRTTTEGNSLAISGGENLTTISTGRVLAFVESRGAAAGVGRANHCTGGPHWASRTKMAKMADAALIRLPIRSDRPFASEDGWRLENERSSYGPQDRH